MQPTATVHVDDHGGTGWRRLSFEDLLFGFLTHPNHNMEVYPERESQKVGI